MKRFLLPLGAALLVGGCVLAGMTFADWPSPPGQYVAKTVNYQPTQVWIPDARSEWQWYNRVDRANFLPIGGVMGAIGVFLLVMGLRPQDRTPPGS